eukprot:6195955-Pleurochrysis_carterae.AAC.2
MASLLLGITASVLTSKSACEAATHLHLRVPILMGSHPRKQPPWACALMCIIDAAMTIFQAIKGALDFLSRHFHIERAPQHVHLELDMFGRTFPRIFWNLVLWYSHGPPVCSHGPHGKRPTDVRLDAVQEFRRWLNENMVAPHEVSLRPPGFQRKQARAAHACHPQEEEDSQMIRIIPRLRGGNRPVGSNEMAAAMLICRALAAMQAL